MTRPRLLDLFCGAGGCAVGYHRAGFDVVGIDIVKQPNYPFRFVWDDALEYVAEHAGEYDAIHASPPCQAYSRAQRLRGREHPELIEPTRERLQASARPYVIENVEGAPLIDPVVLCGTSFGLAADGFEIRRHRLFETNFPVMALPCSHLHPSLPVFGHGPNGDFYKRHGGGRVSNEARNRAMGIDWMTRDEVAEAIPPVFTEHIGGFLMRAVNGSCQEAA